LHANQQRSGGSGTQAAAAFKATQRDTMKHPTGVVLCLTMMASAITFPALAADLRVTMRKATQDGTSDVLGTITISNSDAGTTFKVALHGLPPGAHGFHVYENGTCGPTLLNSVLIPAGAAGGVFDPDGTYKDAGPTGNGHLGDLPVLVVDAKGVADETLIAPRIKDSEVLKGHALIIHIGGDNYSDSPAFLGGGGGRLACGVVE
jgi:Cu-Zn family superoxide dismutase